MSEHYLKLVREEIRSKSLTPLQYKRIEDIFQVYKKIFTPHPWSIIEAQPVVKEVAKESIRLLVDKALKDIETLALVRIMKALTLKQHDASSIDRDVIDTALAVLETEKIILSPHIIRHGDKVFFKFTEKCTIGGKVYRRGEIVLLDTKELLYAVMGGCGHPVVYPMVRQIKS